MFKTNGRVSDHASGTISGFTIDFNGDVFINLDGEEVCLTDKALINKVYDLVEVPIKVEGYKRNGVLYASSVEPV